MQFLITLCIPNPHLHHHVHHAHRSSDCCIQIESLSLLPTLFLASYGASRRGIQSIRPLLRCDAGCQRQMDGCQSGRPGIGGSHEVSMSLASPVDAFAPISDDQSAYGKCA
jgi:hypothetical protein